MTDADSNRKCETSSSDVGRKKSAPVDASVSTCIEDVLPYLEQKIVSNSLRLDDLEIMVRKLNPAAPVSEIIQHLKQVKMPLDEYRPTTSFQDSGGNLDPMVQTGDSCSGIRTFAPLTVETNVSSAAAFVSPVSSAAGSVADAHAATHDGSLSSPLANSAVSERYWSVSSEDTDRRSSLDGNTVWLTNRGPSHEYTLSSPAYSSAGTTLTSAVTSVQNAEAYQMPQNITIKEEPNVEFAELEQHAETGSQFVTMSGRNRGLGKANEPKFVCQICGDVAAGFHCGAYVCEACKKFYLRCLKSGGAVAYSCPKNKECPISKETRSHCQFCRYQKCIDLGMYKPGRDDSRHLRVDFRSIPCKVCAAPSSGFHFGAITCEGCKGFFRRMVKDKLHKKFVCTSGGSCDVASSNRTSCKACRYHKCISIGMALQGTRLGRQSNSVKRSTLIEYQKRHGIDVALFPKLGEEHTDEAVAKVEQLLQSKAPEVQLKNEPGACAATDAHMTTFSPRSEHSAAYATSRDQLESGHTNTTAREELREVSPTQEAADSKFLKFIANTGPMAHPEYQASHDLASHDLARAFSAPAENEGEKSVSAAAAAADLGLRRNTVDDVSVTTDSLAHSVSAIVQEDLPSFAAGLQMPHTLVAAGAKDASTLAGAAVNFQNPEIAARALELLRTGGGHLFSVNQLQELNAAVSQAGLTVHSSTAASHTAVYPGYGSAVSSPQSQLSPPAPGTGSRDVNRPDVNPPDASPSDDSGTKRLIIDGSGYLMDKQRFADDFRRTQLPVDYELPNTPVVLPSYAQSQSFSTSDAARRKRNQSGPSGSSQSKVAKRKLSEDICSTSSNKPTSPSVADGDGDGGGGGGGGSEFNWAKLKNRQFMTERVLEAYRELENLRRPRAHLEQDHTLSTDKERAWYAAYESFMHHAKYTLRFVKKIPGFKQLVMSDQVTLVREAVYPITLLFHSQFYDPTQARQRWFCNTDEERDKIWEFFPKFRELHGHIVYSGSLFRELNVQRDEYAFLCALMVFSTDKYLVKDCEKIDLIMEAITDAMGLTIGSGARGPGRVAQLMLRVSELKRANLEHNKIAMEVQQANPDMDFSQLWHEMFLSK